MKLAILALAVVGASAQTATFAPQPTMQYFPQTAATGYNFATAAPFQYTWPQQTLAPNQQQFYNPYQQWNPFQVAATAAPTAAAGAPKTSRDFSEAVRECVKGQDAWCTGNNWDATCTGFAEGRKCLSSKGVTVAEKEWVDRCIRTKGKKYQDPVGDGGDTWCSRRLNQWDAACTKSEEGCTKEVREIKDKGDAATTAEKKELTDALHTCISRRDAWCNNWSLVEAEKNWDSVCKGIEGVCNAPPVAATAAPTQAPFVPQYFPQQYQMQYATPQGMQYPQYVMPTTTTAPAAGR